MPKRLSYSDAVKLLGGSRSGLIAALDKLTGGVLISATGGGGEFALSLFDVKGELVQLSQELITGLADRMRGLSRFDRTQRLTAAHKVIVLTGFFEAVGAAALPVAGPLLDRPAQVELATGRPPASKRLDALASVLHDSDIPGESAGPLPGALPAFYAALGERLLVYLRDSTAWADLADPGEVVRKLTLEVPEHALRRYEEHLRRLAADFPEVAFWANRLDHVATHRRLVALQAGMEGLGLALEEIAAGTVPVDARREALARRYRSVLDRPIVTTGDLPEGLTIPSLASAYVTPCFRAAEAVESSGIDQEQWWDGHPVRDDLQEFLIGHLTSIAATRSPLIVLGQPGSGKSVLTQVLAARLPASDFLTVRVALRDVPADTDLQSQIEYAIRAATGASLSWPDVAGTAGGALPVILIDGFDELLQASGIGQSDYLERVVRFQEREADQGRPVAVLITIRIAVVDRARIPRAGAVAMRLEPFTHRQVERWLAIWNEHNLDQLTRRGVRPLAAEAALRQPELAAQPLLLLMLALYDAPDNALQRYEGELNRADLYDRILRRFVEREIHKTRPELAGEPLEEAVEHELLRLSVAAFAMFNRGRQWVTDEELSADLSALTGGPAGERRKGGSQTAPTPAQRVVGRFFFIHQTQALRRDATVTTCQFLHSSFGEFLVARQIQRELMAAERAVDDGFMRTLLSFAPLTTGGQVIEFLRPLTGQLSDDRRRLLRGLLLTAFHGALYPPGRVVRSAYRPARIGAPAGHAAYSANLLLLIVMVGGPVNGRELFPGTPAPAAQWRRHAFLWRSQFTAEGWGNLSALLSLRRVWYEGDREVRIGWGEEPSWTPPELDAYWMFRLPPGHPWRERHGWRLHRSHHLLRESYFNCDFAEDIAWHALAPLVAELDYDDMEGADDIEATTAFGVLSAERTVSVTNALTRVWLASSHPYGGDDLERAYGECLRVIVNSRPGGHAVAGDAYLARFLRQLAADRDRLSPEFRARVLDQLKESLLDEAHLDDLPMVRGWAERAFGDLGWSPP
ncbi:hypothetical protein AB0I81_14220 [Nonomuraea sp. NPDC050404]|uniref:NACHT domain-containing protein n=1 Tax=Nonomuraea sp. NPDC050404 TaxID=3155783 RepID=UPI0033FB7CF4